MTVQAVAAPRPRAMEFPHVTPREPFLVDVAWVRAWSGFALFWLPLAPVLGLVAAMKLDDPTLLAVEQLQFGRMRVAHVNGVVFGAFTNAMFAFMAYAFPKLTGQPLPWRRARWLAFWLMQVGFLAGITGILFGFLQPIEAGEMDVFADVPITIGFVVLSATFLWNVAHRSVERMYVSLWYWVAALLWTPINFVIGNYVLPNMTGVNSAAMHGFYLHNVVGLWITPAGVGAASYLIPAAAQARLYSHRLSLIGVWLLAFFYPMNGIHHYIYSPIPDWAQTIAIASSVMLLLPVWAFIANMWGTMWGHWRKFVGGDNFALKFGILGAFWYLITCFQGPLQAPRGVQALTHFTDYNVGHAHSAVFGTFVIWAMAGIYFLLPRYTKNGLWSKKLATWHYWLEIVGFGTMFGALTIGGLQQGYMLRDSDATWVLTMPRDMWIARTLGGTLMDVGIALFLVNMVLTMVVEWRRRAGEARAGAPGTAATAPVGGVS
jgi:cytochrome c oxidase cbb3-type subunit 1